MQQSHPTLTATAAVPESIGNLTSPDFPDRISDFLRGVRRHLHRKPEIGFQEYETSAYIRAVLEDIGLNPSPAIAKTGLFVDIEGELPGPMTAFRADMDALPATDRKQVEYRSTKPGAAHLCGHDAHTAIGLGVALALHRNRAHLRGRVRVFFQPNEEGVPSGAPEMIKAGVLEGVRAAFCVHVDPTLSVGTFGIASGAVTAAADRFQLRVIAPTSGHSARPHQAVDTVWIATTIAQSIYQLVGRVTDPRNDTIITICKFEGGKAINVIPSRVSFGGTVRCTVDSDRQILKDRIHATGESIAREYGAHAELDYEFGAPAVINDPELTVHIRHCVTDIFGSPSVFEIPRPSMGAEDFAHYLKYIPGMLIRVGTSSSRETSYPLHDSRFDIDEDAMPLAVQLMTTALLNPPAL